ncbi:unnamed protein product [Phytophthora lilii]|uniref:Presenilin n=1 Tax=Phytophthora lilii TaxID=2077276 RepID=A0A9W6YJZ9_9STRA|nr:unnamed protein product [Phytophthora lilii]
MYYQDIDSSELSTAAKTEEALLNALLVIVFIAFLTFGIVLLYKFNAMRFFAGYCMLYSATLLGLMGSKLVIIVLCGNLHWVIDRISLTVVMYNFAMVGVLSIFYQKGIPGVLERGYLIVTSVIVAWQLAQLPEWSVWMLLLLLGFWDLFAVLTPVGPLRCLVDLVQEKGTPIPGLLFEADVEDAHVGESVKVRQQVNVRRRRFATRDTVPEHVFIQRLVQAEQVEDPSQNAGAVDASQFQHQVKAFLYDQNSRCQDRGGELARRFQHHQLRLWRNLYSYYGVDFVSKQELYPGIRAVFGDAVELDRGGNGSYSSGRDDREDKSIKLGLGDFIFYSVLVARASLHGFAVFTVCFLSILVVSFPPANFWESQLTTLPRCATLGPRRDSLPTGTLRRVAGAADLAVPRHHHLPAHNHRPLPATGRAPGEQHLRLLECSYRTWAAPCSPASCLRHREFADSDTSA